jgi:DNA-binding NarL/FixJ family response regulator
VTWLEALESRSEIGSDLPDVALVKVSVNTIATHMRHVYEKLQVHSKSEAVSKALRNRLVR